MKKYPPPAFGKFSGLKVMDYCVTLNSKSACFLTFLKQFLRKKQNFQQKTRAKFKLESILRENFVLATLMQVSAVVFSKAGNFTVKLHRKLHNFMLSD